MLPFSVRLPFRESVEGFPERAKVARRPHNLQVRAGACLRPVLSSDPGTEREQERKHPRDSVVVGVVDLSVDHVHTCTCICSCVCVHVCTHTHSPYTTETQQGQEPLSCPKGLFGTLTGACALA